MELVKKYEEEKKTCLVLYGIQEGDKPNLLSSLKSKNYDYFSEEGNLLIVWGETEREQLKTLAANKLIIDKVLTTEGFNPNQVHPKIIEQLNLLKNLTTKCK